LEGLFTYQGFNLEARSLTDGRAIQEISGTYTITLFYDYDYFTNVIDLPPFEGQIKLYRWVPGAGYWTPVSATLDLDNDTLVAMTSAFGDFALVMEVERVYMPMVVRSY